MSNARYPEWQAEAAEALIAPIVAGEPGPVLLCLQAVQVHFGYVPGDAVAMIAELAMSPAPTCTACSPFMLISAIRRPLRCRCACAPPRLVRP